MWILGIVSLLGGIFIIIHLTNFMFPLYRACGGAVPRAEE